MGAGCERGHHHLQRLAERADRGQRGRSGQRDLRAGNGATVSGNYTVQRGAESEVYASTINGNYTCSNCDYVDLHEGSVVGGNFLISGESAGSFINGGDTIKGDLVITTSKAGSFDFEIDDATIGGNLSFNNNEGERSSRTTRSRAISRARTTTLRR